MALLKQNQQQYYSGRRSFTGDGTTLKFTLSTTQSTFPLTYQSCASCATVYVDGSVLPSSVTDSAGVTTTNWVLTWDVTDYWHIDFTLGTAPSNGAVIDVEVDTSRWTNPATFIDEDIINYQFVTIGNIIDNFMMVYTGENKMVSKINRTDVQFHAMRALQELSFDTLKSTKSQEIEVPSSLTMILPQDYVNYVKLTWSDSAGIEHIIYPARKTSNPKAIKQDSNGDYSFDFNDDGFDDTDSLINPINSDTWASYKSATPSENTFDYDEDVWPLVEGQRFGLNPQFSQTNGSFFIDELKGLIHFSSNMSNKTVTLKYISDGLGTDEEMIVHKFAEEAMYMWIMYSIVSTRANTPEYIVNRFKKEKFAQTRKAKLRLSNFKLEEFSQVLRGKSKQIKH